MSRKRSTGGRSEDLLPENRVEWTKGIWTDKETLAQVSGGAWLLREAAKALSLPEEAVDEVLSKHRAE